MRHRSRAVASGAVVLGLLLQLAVVAAAAHARPVVRHTELKPPSRIDAILSPPVKRSPDVVRQERLLRVPVERRATSLRIALIDDPTDATLAPATAPPRARSHAQRLRSRPPDDPPQSDASA